MRDQCDSNNQVQRVVWFVHPSLLLLFSHAPSLCNCLPRSPCDLPIFFYSSPHPPLSVMTLLGITFLHFLLFFLPVLTHWFNKIPTTRCSCFCKEVQCRQNLTFMFVCWLSRCLSLYVYPWLTLLCLYARWCIHGLCIGLSSSNFDDPMAIPFLVSSLLMLTSHPPFHLLFPHSLPTFHHGIGLTRIHLIGRTSMWAPQTDPSTWCQTLLLSDWVQLIGRLIASVII